MEPEGRTALVTGGSRGIGRAIAVALARDGVRVAINYLRNKAAAVETLKEIEACGSGGLVVKANVAEESGIETIFGRIREEFGALDVLVSNAAMGVLRSIPELTVRHFAWTMGINALSLIPLAQRAIPLMLERGGGHIVAVSSLGATRAIPNYTAVGASKAALESIVRHLAIEMAGKNINVNAVSAGIVDTDALKHFPNRDELLTKSLARTPAGRLTTPEDVAQVVRFLCQPGAAMIHGQTLVVDGGYSIMG